MDELINSVMGGGASPSAAGSLSVTGRDGEMHGGGLGAVLDKYENAVVVNGSTAEAVGPPGDLSPVDMLKLGVGKYVSAEEVLGEVLSDMSVKKGGHEERMDDAVTDSMARFEEYTSELLSIQMAYQYKSLNGALLLSAGKSAEGFVKTLMRSQ